jgi:Rha family phage regulatory protein
MHLVTTDGKAVLTDSQIIAKALSMKHNDVMRAVYRLLDDRPELRGAIGLPKTEMFIRLEQRNYRGKDFEAAVMDRDAFMFLVMRFETQKAYEMQIAFIKAFKEMERRLLQTEANRKDQSWIASRESGKIGRKDETDVIKEFVEYATAQGSKSAQFYYKHITMATYRALELLVQRKPKLRDTLNCYELAELLLAERLVMVKLKEYMDKGRNYKDIYETVADDLIAYASTIRLPMTVKTLEQSGIGESKFADSTPQNF